jgi:hypothetical protein
MGSRVLASSGRAGRHYFKAYLTFEEFRQRAGVALGHPVLQLGVAPRPHPDEQSTVLGNHFERGDDLRVAPIEPLGQPQQGREHADSAAPAATQGGELRV